MVVSVATSQQIDHECTNGFSNFLTVTMLSSFFRAMTQLELNSAMIWSCLIDGQFLDKVSDTLSWISASFADLGDIDTSICAQIPPT